MDTDASVPSQGSQKRIMLVEDDDALANVYMSRMQAEGFVMKRASNGEEALSTVSDYRPDLIMLDIMMPKISGFEVLEQLRDLPAAGNAKIIVLSALGQDGDKVQAEALGADAYLVKSQVVITDVIGRVRQLLGMDG